MKSSLSLSSLHSLQRGSNLSFSGPPSVSLLTWIKMTLKLFFPFLPSHLLGLTFKFLLWFRECTMKTGSMLEKCEEDKKQKIKTKTKNPVILTSLLLIMTLMKPVWIQCKTTGWLQSSSCAGLYLYSGWSTGLVQAEHWIHICRTVDWHQEFPSCFTITGSLTSCAAISWQIISNHIHWVAQPSGYKSDLSLLPCCYTCEYCLLLQLFLI